MRIERHANVIVRRISTVPVHSVQHPIPRKNLNEVLVTRDARDQHGAREPVTVELLDPSFRELLRILGRELESEVLAQRIEERDFVFCGPQVSTQRLETGREFTRLVD